MGVQVPHPANFSKALNNADGGLLVLVPTHSHVSWSPHSLLDEKADELMYR